MQRCTKATPEEIDALKKLVRKVDAAVKADLKPEATPMPPVPQAPEPDPENCRGDWNIEIKANSKIFRQIENVVPTKPGLNIDNPVQLLMMLMPELKPYKWQFEILMMTAGYLKPGDYKTKTPISIENPFKLIASCANGSGKDMVLIAAFAVWFALIKPRNRVVITSSSYEQIKSQTEVHIRELVIRANKKFGQLFRFTQFHYVCPELGSEIKLFVTDEPGRAEGWHPYAGGDMALIVNEAKTVSEAIFDALWRCTGYSHWLEVSSPGSRTGHMYKMASSAVQYPAPAILGQFYFRRVTAYECPHLPESHIRAIIYDKGEQNPLVRSSIFAEFSDYDEPVVIPLYSYEKCENANVKENGSDIGIGLDLAGGGDEDVIFVRKGNRVVFWVAFRQVDTDLAALSIDKYLSAFRETDYIFRADNGGLGQAIIDKLVGFGWRIRRTNNQSPASNKREFLNLGAEMYFKVKRMIERLDIILPKDVQKLKDQITTRKYDGETSAQGKFALQSKKQARLEGLHSPDRADAFVLCFSSYRPYGAQKEEAKPKSEVLISMEQALFLAHRGFLFRRDPPKPAGRLTQQLGKI